MSVGPAARGTASALWGRGGGGAVAAWHLPPPRRALRGCRRPTAPAFARRSARPAPPPAPCPLRGLRARSSAQNGCQSPTRKRGGLSPSSAYMAGGRWRGMPGKQVHAAAADRRRRAAAPAGGRLAFPAAPAAAPAHARRPAFLPSAPSARRGGRRGGLAGEEPARGDVGGKTWQLGRVTARAGEGRGLGGRGRAGRPPAVGRGRRAPRPGNGGQGWAAGPGGPRGLRGRGFPGREVPRPAAQPSLPAGIETPRPARPGRSLIFTVGYVSSALNTGDRRGRSRGPSGVRWRPASAYPSGFETFPRGLWPGGFAGRDERGRPQRERAVPVSPQGEARAATAGRRARTRTARSAAPSTASLPAGRVAQREATVTKIGTRGVAGSATTAVAEHGACRSRDLFSPRALISDNAFSHRRRIFYQRHSTRIN